jgi:hypothetical protein
MTQEFSAKIYKLGINPCVDVPKRVSQAFAKRGYVPIKGLLNGQPIRATLVPKGNFTHRLFLNTDMRNRAKLGVGDRAYLILEVDEQPRSIGMPEAFAVALKERPKAKAAYEGLRPSKRKEILTYLNWVKREETLKRNIDKTIRRLEKEVESKEAKKK